MCFKTCLSRVRKLLYVSRDVAHCHGGKGSLVCCLWPEEENVFSPHRNPAWDVSTWRKRIVFYSSSVSQCLAQSLASNRSFQNIGCEWIYLLKLCPLFQDQGGHVHVSRSRRALFFQCVVQLLKWRPDREGNPLVAHNCSQTGCCWMTPSHRAYVPCSA